MEKPTPCFIMQCLKPTCRFRYPSSEDPGTVNCPKCGGPMQAKRFESQPPASQLFDSPSQTIEVLVDNVRSAYNVGSILRTSDAVNVSHLHFCGTTPAPDNPKVRKTALGAEFSTPWTQHWNALDAVLKLKQRGYSIVSLELSLRAVSFFDLKPDQLKFPMVLIVGSEVTGVDPEILDHSSHILQIPMMGAKGSINVATAFGVAVYFLRYLEYKTSQLS